MTKKWKKEPESREKSSKNARELYCIRIGKIKKKANNQGE